MSLVQPQQLKTNAVTTLSHTPPPLADRLIERSRDPDASVRLKCVEVVCGAAASGPTVLKGMTPALLRAIGARVQDKRVWVQLCVLLSAVATLRVVTHTR